MGARYKIYPAADGRLIAVGALEQKFWIAFCDVIGMSEALRDDALTLLRSSPRSVGG